MMEVYNTECLCFTNLFSGGTPYPTINNQDLMYQLKAGYRMEKPNNCAQEM